MDTNQYMDMFLDESHEHLQSLNEGLLSLEENPEEISVVNDIFRNAHTLKGMSATMGYNKIAELTHEMEDVLDLIRKEQLKLDEDIIDTLFKCLDSLEQMIDSVANGDSEDVVDVSDLVAKLSSISKGEPAPAITSNPWMMAAIPITCRLWQNSCATDKWWTPQRWRHSSTVSAGRPQKPSTASTTSWCKARKTDRR